MKKLFVILLVCSASMLMNSLNAVFEGEHAVLCKSRQTGHNHTAYLENCSKEAQEAACNTHAGIADPVSCKLYTSEPELDKLWADNGLDSILECKVKASGTGFRYLVPDCSEGSKKDICGMEYLQVTGCKVFGKDLAGLKKAKEAHINKAAVTCTVAGIEYEIPALDCEPDTKRAACTGARPVSCVYRKI